MVCSVGNALQQAIFDRDLRSMAGSSIDEIIEWAASDPG